METTAIFSVTTWTYALGWSLLHSLWMSVVIWLGVRFILRITAQCRAALRYRVATAGLLIFIAAVAGVFVILLEKARLVSTDAGLYTSPAIGMHLPTGAGDGITAGFTGFINTHMPLILGVWVTGTLLFLLRLAAGIYTTQKLRATARPVHVEWSAQVRTLADSLGIRRVVALAESASVASPLVIGWLKPVILLPLGMGTGLTTEQLETIFVHELAHIKRGDYLVNILQAVAEAIFFFNPFIWALSGIIRREREYCCDDVVLSQRDRTSAYAHALTQLASMRLEKHQLALPLGETRNELLRRIRRIMEPETPQSLTPERIIFPAVLLTVGLLTMSWLGIHLEDRFSRPMSASVQDTMSGQAGKEVRHFSRSIVTQDEERRSHEDVVEGFEGDEAVLTFMQEARLIPDAPELRGPANGSSRDTIPRPPSFPFNNDAEWESFSKALEDHLRSGIGGMRTWDEERFSDLMRELHESFGPGDWFSEHLSQTFDGIQAPGDSITIKELDRALEDLHHFRMEELEEELQDLENEMQQLREMHLREFSEQTYIDFPAMSSRHFVQALRLHFSVHDEIGGVQTTFNSRSPNVLTVIITQ